MDCKSNKKILLEPCEFRSIRKQHQSRRNPAVSWEYFRNTIRREVVGIEKISCNNRALSIG